MAILPPVTTVRKAGDVRLYGDVQLSGGNNITLTETGQTINIAANSETIGDTIIGGTSGSILFVGLSGGQPILQQDNANLFWDDPNNRMSVGTTTNSFNLNGTPLASKLMVQASTGELVTTALASYSSSIAPSTYFLRSGGTPASKTIVSASDVLGSFGAFGYNGTDFTQAASINFLVDGTPGAADMPGAILFAVTPDGSTSPGIALAIRQNKFAEFADGGYFSGQLSVGQATTATAQQDTIIGTASRVGQVIKGAASQTADLSQWVNSASSGLTGITSDGDFRYNRSSRSITGTVAFFDSGAVTHTVSQPSSISVFRSNDTYNFTATQAGFNGTIIFGNQITFKNDPSLTGELSGLVAVNYYNAPIYKADTTPTTFSAVLFGGFTDNTTFTIANGGTLGVTGWTSFVASGSSASGVTITNRRGLHVNNMAGGTITTQTGIEIDDIVTGTTKIGIRQKGTNAHNRIVGKTYIGSDTTPTTQLQVAGDFCTTQTAVTFANPCTVTTTSSNSFKISAASGNFTVNASAAGTAGQHMIIQWSADAGGARTITYGTNFKSTGTQASGGASRTATSLWTSDGASWWEVARTNNLI